ncbi:uncharacterized protein [Argopecten irradians]|uniref:uncharacterized protein isoform X2 n=1 Tax=Argopecten irradians TaxID=31199 RepID=UPI0037196530
MGNKMATRSPRLRQIKSKNGDVVDSYHELNNTAHFPIARARPRQLESWTTGIYPVEILHNDHERSGYVKVHYIGWNKKYDETIKTEEIVTLPRPFTTFSKKLAVAIKESLGPCSKVDSLVKLKLPISEEEYNLLSNSGTPHKVTRTKTVYKISSRNQLNHYLGEGWDYRICNEECDNIYVLTSTVKFYLHVRKPLEDYQLFPDHVEKYRIDRGFQLTFSFVRKCGNRSDVNKLLNSDKL